MTKVFKVLILGLVLSINIFAYEIEVPNSLHGDCSQAEACSSYFQSARITLRSINSHSSKILINFIPSSMSETEKYVYIVTLPYDLAVTNIQYINVDLMTAIPANNRPSEENKIPEAIGSIIKEIALSRTPKFLQKIAPVFEIAFDLGGSELIQNTSPEPSILQGFVNNNTLLDRDTYPYISFYGFFTRSSRTSSMLVYTVNKSLDEMVNILRDKKMSVYIGGNRENEMLVEKFSPNENSNSNDGQTSDTNDNDNVGGCTVNHINLNQNIQGSYSSNCASVHKIGSYAQYYKFTLDSSQEVTITLDADYSDDAYLYLLNSTGSTIREYDDDGAGNHDSKIVTTLPAGTYRIEATTYNANKTGNFNISVNTSSTNNDNTDNDGGGCTVNRITLDEDIQGNYSSNCASLHRTGSYAQYYRFTLDSTKIVIINLDADYSDDAYLYLLNSTGSSILEENDDGAGNHDSKIVTRLPAGTYRIEATTYNTNKTGNFNISVMTR